MFFLNLFTWIAASLLVGFVASRVVNLRGDDPKFGMGAAAGGGILAALVYMLISSAAFGVWNLWAMIFAAVGATIAVVVWHAVRARSISHTRYVPRSSY
jgi:uncharacterized membrane protein YeaQ/YmgE (transglycosylase-associated protein family)